MATVHIHIGQHLIFLALGFVLGVMLTLMAKRG